MRKQVFCTFVAQVSTLNFIFGEIKCSLERRQRRNRLQIVVGIVLKVVAQKHLKGRSRGILFGFIVHELAEDGLFRFGVEQFDHAGKNVDVLVRLASLAATLAVDLDDEQSGVLVQLKASETACRHLEAGYPFAAEAAGRLRSVLEELKDLGASAAAQSERLDADPERLQKIGDRLNTIYSLCQKHRAADLGELLAKQTDYEARLQAITHGDEAIAAVATELTATEEKAEELARNIHATREKAAPTFNDAIQTTLARLGMPEARFVVQLTPAPALTPTGDDEIDFLFTANGNFAPQKVERIASGGEISRVMLALKALLAHRMELPTIIFDEIDTGVSGRIADAMGEIIADLSQTMQVVDITHLPQVASKGDTHFVVYKDAEGSHIRRLDPEERITEIAKMLSGSQITEAALAQARILLDK